MAKKAKKPQGGARPKAGRKFKYGEPTVNRMVRVPESKVEEFDEFVDTIRKEAAEENLQK